MPFSNFSRLLKTDIGKRFPYTIKDEIFRNALLNSDILYSEQAPPDREPLKNWSKASYKQYNCMDLNGIVLFQEYKPPWKGNLPIRQGKEQIFCIFNEK